MREKELRLALICYGGVSLAVYMHGVTREIWHLARASRDMHEGRPRAKGSQGVYHELLEIIEHTCGLKLRVITDIIAGSSAGGINGVFLAQAIATGQSLEPLTDLWLETADVERLIDPDARPLSRFSKFWATPIAWAILRRKGGLVEQTVSKEAQDEVATKLSRFVRARWFAPPFGGAQFSELLLDAFEAMANGPNSGPLLPEGQPLDLFVTVTDYYGYEQQLRLNSPSVVSETEHRLTIHFSTHSRDAGSGTNRDAGATLGAIPELAFAARTTASFPGAFTPFKVAEMDRLVAARKMPWPGREAFLKRILPSYYAAGTIEDAVLIDGSILANAPFAQALGALRNRPARREIDRRFIYIDPKPGLPSFRYQPKRGVDGDDAKNIRTKDAGLPGWFATIFGATSNIPREQPIRDALEKIQGRTRRIQKMREVISGLQDEVDETIEALIGGTLFLSRPTPVRLAKWRAMAQEKGARAAGYSYPAYGHLKLADIIDDITRTAQRILDMPDIGYSDMLRQALWTEAERRGLDHLGNPKGNPKGRGASEAAIGFFQQHDLGFRIRRLRFLARRLEEDIENVSEGKVPGLENMHEAIYAALALYLDRETAAYLGTDFALLAQDAVAQPAAFLDALSQRRNLTALDLETDRLFCDALLHIEGDAQRSMLLGYLGYPIYDIATLPLLQGEGLDEFDPVKVDRISPDDCSAIRKGGAAATLKGIEFNNFGAFFSRAYRENDYLWGRLHGAERMLDIVLGTLPQGTALSEGVRGGMLKALRNAILDQEESRLTRIMPLFKALRTEMIQM